MPGKRIAVAILTILCFSCGENAVYEDVSSLPAAGWDFRNKAEFEYVISDVSASYDVKLLIRNTKEYKYSNLWLFVNTKSPDGKFQQDTLEVFLADESGRWLGESKQSLNSLLVPYRMNVNFPARGIYETTIQHAMRDTTLQHVIDIGIRVEYHIK